MAVQTDRLDQLMGKALDELAASLGIGLVSVGERAGLWQGLAGAGRLTSEELAERTGTHERYVREWLRGMAAAGWVVYDPAGDVYSLEDEVAFMMNDPDGPSVPSACMLAMAILHSAPQVAERFRTGDGFGWGEHHHELFPGTERFFRPQYAAHLVDEWIPALDGVEQALRDGARVADLGCGHGASTILMAKAFPESRFTGFDFHAPSIARAREIAEEEGVADRVTFEVGAAEDLGGGPWDLIAMFDCLHDMGDPVSVARRIREALAPDGTWMLVEPMAGDSVSDNLNPVGRLFYAASTLVCTPASLAQEGRAALGAQAGERTLTDVMRAGGFTRVRRATETPVNLVLEARP
jgi:2-polyprenyl-3-methyl-5-hydroxy-6-metoxy-1,4-benzoquinol methylase